MTEEIPEYLGRESARQRKMIVRFRCGKEEKKQVLHGRRGRERQLSTCGTDVAKYLREREGKKRREILNEDGREIGWMKEI
jgi:hypothetical protein